MKLENLKLSEVIKLIEDKPDEIVRILNQDIFKQIVATMERFTITPHFWTSRNSIWTVELKPIKKELTRDDLAEAWDVCGVTLKNAKLANESKFFKAICERLGI